MPSSEVCDGLDNDCDGSVDEGNPGGGGACNTGLLGICSSGTQHCQSGAIQCVQDNMPSSEVCDGLDNDCNPASADGSEDPMTGTDCDGPDSDLCEEGVYECVAGSQSCTDNTSNTYEQCNHQDDDCDGQVDEGITCECYNNNDNECPCGGNPRSCSSYSSSSSCKSAPGCSWIIFSCIGTARPCDSYSRGECELHDGCHLEYCDNGDCHP